MLSIILIVKNIAFYVINIIIFKIYYKLIFSYFKLYLHKLSLNF